MKDYLALLARKIIISLILLPTLVYATPYTFTITASKTTLTKQQEKNAFLITIISPSIHYLQNESYKNFPAAAGYTTAEKFLAAWKKQEVPYNFFNGILGCNIKNDSEDEAIAGRFYTPKYDRNNNVLTFIIKPFSHNKGLGEQKEITCGPSWIVGFDGDMELLKQ